MDIRNLGNFANIQAVWTAYPNGGIEGDYLFIPDSQGTKYRWNKFIQQWENAAVVTETTAREQTTFSDLAVQNELNVAGNARFRGNMQVDGMLVSPTLEARFDQQDEAINRLDGNDVVVVDDHTQVQNPDPEKIYREPGELAYTDWMYYNDEWKKLATHSQTPTISMLVDGDGNETGLMTVTYYS